MYCSWSIHHLLALLQLHLHSRLNTWLYNRSLSSKEKNFNYIHHFKMVKKKIKYILNYVKNSLRLSAPYGDIDLGYIGASNVARWHQAIIWADVDLSLVRFCGIQLRTISQRVPKLLFCILSLKIVLIKILLPNVPRANYSLRPNDAYLHR